MTDLLATPNPFPDVLLDSLRKRYPFYGRGTPAGAIGALRGALDRLTQGELDGKPLPAEAAAAFLRGKIDQARIEFAGREKRFVPHFQSWLNSRRYLSTATEAPPPENLQEAIDILAIYPTIQHVDIKTHMPVLRVIDDAVRFYQATHGSAAAAYIRQRVYRYAECVAKWPDGELQFIPGADKWFRERRYEQDESRWKREFRNGYEADRAQITRLIQ